MLAWAVFHLASLLLAADGAAVEKYKSGKNSDYEAALRFLKENDVLSTAMSNREQLVNWNYESNLTEENKKVMLKSGAEAAKFALETWKNVTSFTWQDFEARNKTVYRWFKLMSVLGTAALSEDKIDRFKSLIADMTDNYAKAKVCALGSPPGKPCELALEPELYDRMRDSRDPRELKHLWTEWRKVSGRRAKAQYLEFTRLNNEAATLNGFKDAGEMWKDEYETETLEKDVEDLLKEIEPLYKQLHAYVRRRLIEQYPNYSILPDGPIPAHLLGNMWAQTWGNVFEIVKPFPRKKTVDVSNRMRDKKLTALQMFKMSEEFFTSLGMKPMTPEFWNRSIIEKPKDREIVCHASAWDFSDGKDYRIKMCTKINMEDFVTVHHEMGHIVYDMQYAHQPQVFREGANPGFHEAIGDVIALSVASSSHLKKIGLLDEEEEDEEVEINKLMEIALDKVPFLPYGHLLDYWRWKLFSGEIGEDELNTKYWEMRLKYQGVCPPVRRTNEDFDVASKYHVVAGVSYVRYFISHIIQFQFHKALCEAAGHTGPLHKCDIYQNREAGKLLSDTLRLGYSVHWTEAMNVITRGRTNKMDAQPMLEFFEPLTRWLRKQNEAETLGWKSVDPMICPCKQHKIKQF